MLWELSFQHNTSRLAQASARSASQPSAPFPFLPLPTQTCPGLRRSPLPFPVAPWKAACATACRRSREEGRGWAAWGGPWRASRSTEEGLWCLAALPWAERGTDGAEGPGRASVYPRCRYRSRRGGSAWIPSCWGPTGVMLEKCALGWNLAAWALEGREREALSLQREWELQGEEIGSREQQMCQWVGVRGGCFPPCKK